MSEKLTDEERREIMRGVPAYAERAKALRVIDAQAAEIDRLRLRDSEDWPALAELAVSVYKSRLAAAAEIAFDEQASALNRLTRLRAILAAQPAKGDSNG